jgi:hypothetical protein
VELAHSPAQQSYIKQVKALEAKIDEATQGELDVDQLEEAQEQLDALAEKYQQNDKIGSGIYKLYELQAAIHYFNGNDAAAFDFIEKAMEIRGGSYPTAEGLKAQLLKNSGPNVGGALEGEPPLQLQAFTKGIRVSAIIMVVIAVISVYFIPWAVFYIILATKLDPKKVPSRNWVKAAAIATLPLCLGLIPIIIDIEFWRMNKRLKDFEEQGARAFMSDEEWIEGEPKRKRAQRVPLIILLSIVAIFVLLILVAVASS